MREICDENRIAVSRRAVVFFIFWRRLDVRSRKIDSMCREGINTSKKLEHSNKTLKMVVYTKALCFEKPIP